MGFVVSTGGYHVLGLGYFLKFILRMLKKIALLCILCTCASFVFSQQVADAESDTISSKAAQLEKSGNFINKLDGNTPLNTLVGIKPDGCHYAIIIDRIEITEKGGFLDASASIPIPGSTKPLCFKAKRVPFSASGGFNGSCRLELVSEIRTPLIGGAEMVVAKDGKTFVEFDCNGFRQMGLSADLLLNPSFITPADTSKDKQVKAHIETVVKDANDILASISIAPFRIKGVKDFIFTVKEASWDQSDGVNPSGFTFPSSYSNPFYSSNPTLWRGFFFKQVEVKLPGYLNGNSKDPITVSANNLIFDDSGVSGTFSATSVLTLEKGEIAKGFALSISKVEVEISENELVKGALNGFIRLPISSKDTLGYSAMADAAGKFVFTAAPTDTLDVDIWKAKAMIYPSSMLTIDNKEDGITIKMLLNGNMTFGVPVANGSSKKLALTAPFEGLFLSNKAPYFEVKAFGLDNLNANYSIAGIGFSLNSIGVSCTSGRASLILDMKLAIGGSGSNAFAAGGRVTLKAAQVNSTWRFNGISIDKFSLDTEFSGFKLSGDLALFNDSKQFGDGVSGSISMTLKPLEFTVKAAAVFGKVDGYKYWYTDALSTTSIPVGTGLTITSLGGGAYSKMRQGAANNASEDYGKGSSGISYIPDRKMSFGFMAQVGLASTDGKLVNGDAALEMAFNAHGGISYISFLGHAKIMALGGSIGNLADKIKSQAGKLADAVDKINTSVGSLGDKLGVEVVKSEHAVDLKDKAEKIATELKKNDAGAPITATLFSIFDFDNRSFFAKLEATVDLAGVLKGANEGGKAGEMVMYFGPDKWYIHCGTPKTPIGLELLGFARITSYFMMGHDMPAFPEPPKEVTDIIGLDKVDRSRDISSLSGGTGIAFGASFKMDTGNMEFLMFYARFAAGLGFDVMLKDYGNASCAGGDGTLGINGWYAMGQAWAYVEGEVGIRVRMMFIKGRFPIFKLGVGTLLEAQLPNPCWFHGAVGGYYNILGGAVKGRCKFEFELGKKCKIKSNAKDLLANMKVISELRPSDAASDVSVFSKPQAVLNMPVEKLFAIDAPDGEKYMFRAKLDRFVALNGGTPIDGVMQLNEDSTVVTIKPHCTLPPKKSVTVSCELSFEEYKKGRWVKVLDEGRPVTETKAVTFTTGEAPNFIPEDNVDIEYPVRGQKAFYRDEYGKGFVVLDAWQNYLFTNPKFKAYAQFRVGDQVVARSVITTSYDKKQIDFDIPQSLLSTSTDYKLVLVNEPMDKNTSTDKNVVKKESVVKETEGDVGDISITTKEATEDLVIAEDKELYTVVFSTSSFRTFREKVLNIEIKAYKWRANANSDIPIVKYMTKEGFDKLEQEGIRQTNQRPLVAFETDLTPFDWYSKDVYPYIYEGYPYLKSGIVSRNVKIFGLPPFVAISMNKEWIYFNVPMIIGEDYRDVRYRLGAYFEKRYSFSEQERARLLYLLNTPVRTFETKGTSLIPLTIKYMLPNGVMTDSLILQFRYN